MVAVVSARFADARVRRTAMSAFAVAAGTTLALALATVGSVGTGTPLASQVASAADGAAEGNPPLDEPAIPVRIRVPDLGIDLPVVSSERNVPGNDRDYPLCDVAQYWTIYDLPGAPGTTWIYAHAQPGMFLPLFLSANATSGSGLLGRVITLQLGDGRLLRYRVDEVRQHAYNRRIALRDRPGQHLLVLQTSEGPPGTIPKLQVAARLVGAGWTDEKPPKPQPRPCWQPRAVTTTSANGGRNGPRNGGRNGTDTPDSASAIPSETGDSVDSGSLALGGGAVLLGATVFAVWLVRRPPSNPRRQQ
jgi:hypothetical protein